MQSTNWCPRLAIAERLPDEDARFIDFCHSSPYPREEIHLNVPMRFTNWLPIPVYVALVRTPVVATAPDAPFASDSAIAIGCVCDALVGACHVTRMYMRHVD